MHSAYTSLWWQAAKTTLPLITSSPYSLLDFWETLLQVLMQWNPTCICSLTPILCQTKRLPLIGIWEDLHLWHSRVWEHKLAQWTGAEISISQEECKEGLMYSEQFASPSRWEVPPMTFCCCELWTPTAAWATPVGAGISNSTDQVHSALHCL